MDKIVHIFTESLSEQKDIKSSLSMIKVVIDGIRNFRSDDTIKDVYPKYKGVSESISSLEMTVNLNLLFKEISYETNR